MAKKRALVDAVISATRSSGMFTQDIEDTDNNYAQSAKNLSTHSTGKTSNSNDNSNEITSNVYASQENTNSNFFPSFFLLLSLFISLTFYLKGLTPLWGHALLDPLANKYRTQITRVR